jgi:hypothetical protein
MVKGGGRSNLPFKQIPYDVRILAEDLKADSNEK